MKGYEDPALLTHKRQVDTARQQKAIMRERARRARAAGAMRVMADPNLRPSRKEVSA